MGGSIINTGYHNDIPTVYGVICQDRAQIGPYSFQGGIIFSLPELFPRGYYCTSIINCGVRSTDPVNVQ